MAPRSWATTGGSCPPANSNGRPRRRIPPGARQLVRQFRASSGLRAETGTLLVHPAGWIIWGIRCPPRFGTRVPSATDRSRIPRWLDVPCAEPRQRPRPGLPRARGLPLLSRDDGRGHDPHPDAGPGLLPDAQPFPPGPLVSSRRRSQPLDALALDHPCPPLFAALQGPAAMSGKVGSRPFRPRRMNTCTSSSGILPRHGSFSQILPRQQREAPTSPTRQRGPRSTPLAGAF
jgi:hypothetical protein